MLFGKWKEDIHESEKQQKKIEKAKSRETTPKEVDKQNETAVFLGSKGKSEYKTTLDNCTCRSFILDKIPCKHMYRLAMELGKVDIEPEYGTNKNEKFDISILENMPDEILLTMQSILYQNIWGNKDKYGNVEKKDRFYLLREEGEKLFKTGLFVEDKSADLLRYFREEGCLCDTKEFFYSVGITDIPVTRIVRKRFLSLIDEAEANYKDIFRKRLEETFCVLEFSDYLDVKKGEVYTKLTRMRIREAWIE